MTGSLNLISPYQQYGRWVFDVEESGLVAEPFIEADEVITALVNNIPEANKGFNLMFADFRFSGHQQMLVNTGEEENPWLYHCKHLDVHGSLRSVLSRFYEVAPEKISVSATPQWKVVEKG